MSNHAIAQVVSFVAVSNAGETALLEKVVNELKHRGYRVGSIQRYLSRSLVKTFARAAIEVDKP